MTGVNAPKQTRRERAAATRVRMIEAALEVFVEKGYPGTRMADIAERAGVAVQTLYFTFHTKPELLEACYAHTVMGGPGGAPPMETVEIRAAFAARTGRAALRAFARGNATIAGRAAAIDSVAAAATHEPEVARVRAHSEALRRDNFAHLARSLDERFGLARDVDAATDLLMVLSNGSTYLALAAYGWSLDEYADWLADVLATQLLARPGRPRGLS